MTSWLSAPKAAGAFRLVLSRNSIPYLYLAIALAAALLLCFLTPPIQVPDEGRHLLRACQVAQGQILPQIDPVTHQAGGLLPVALSEFVRDKMNPEFFRHEDQLRSIGARLRALDQAAQSQPPLSERRFAAFPGSAIYPPPFYLPQTAAIELARVFSDKIYVWFYSARVLNAIIAVLLVFLALRLAPAHQFVLMVPAILPMSLYLISSVSDDAAIISVSILFVALCTRFLERDGMRLRGALIVCLLLLTLTKPVYLPFALLLLAAYKRLGWRRAVLFCAAALAVAAGTYLAWSYFVLPAIGMAGNDYNRHNPSAQVHFVLAHPIGFAMVFLRTLKLDTRQKIFEVIGFFGWNELPFPPWFYKLTYCFFAVICTLTIPKFRRIDWSRILWASLAGVSTVFAIFLASFVLWAPVGAPHVPWIQGNYYIPILASLPFFVLPLDRLGNASRIALGAFIFCFFALSVFTTVRIERHYYFPESTLLGRNIHELFTETPTQSCAASVEVEYARVWFSSIAAGRADIPGKFRVLLTDENGTILAESDPVLVGADFPFDLLPGSSHSRWLLHFWTTNRFATLHYWLVTGKNACTFGPELKLQPYHIPAA